MQFKNLKWGIYLPARHRGATYYKSLRGNFYLFTSNFILYPLSFVLYPSYLHFNHKSLKIPHIENGTVFKEQILAFDPF